MAAAPRTPALEESTETCSLHGEVGSECRNALGSADPHHPTTGRRNAPVDHHQPSFAGSRNGVALASTSRADATERKQRGAIGVQDVPPGPSDRSLVTEVGCTHDQMLACELVPAVHDTADGSAITPRREMPEKASAIHTTGESPETDSADHITCETPEKDSADHATDGVPAQVSVDLTTCEGIKKTFTSLASSLATRGKPVPTSLGAKHARQPPTQSSLRGLRPPTTASTRASQPRALA